MSRMKESLPIHYHQNGCQEWIGEVNRNGYGRLGRSVAHRVLWISVHGPVPKDHVLDHVAGRCSIGRACVADAHLEVVTGRENTLRGDGPSACHARQTVCKRGHLLPESRNSQGRRVCCACRRFSRTVRAIGQLSFGGFEAESESALSL